MTKASGNEEAKITRRPRGGRAGGQRARSRGLSTDLQSFRIRSVRSEARAAPETETAEQRGRDTLVRVRNTSSSSDSRRR